jgi:YqcI/YcgG family
MRSIYTDLSAFCKVYEAERYSGYVFDAASAGSEDLREFESSVSLFRSVLLELWRLDGGNKSTALSNIEDRDWQYSLCAVRMFVNLFAPAYPLYHTKHVPVRDRIVVFLQPERSFDFCDINPSRREVRRRIRELFARAGRPYSGELIDARIEAHLYVFPLELNGAIVRWWET